MRRGIASKFVSTAAARSRSVLCCRNAADTPGLNHIVSLLKREDHVLRVEVTVTVPVTLFERGIVRHIIFIFAALKNEHEVIRVEDAVVVGVAGHQISMSGRSSAGGADAPAIFDIPVVESSLVIGDLQRGSIAIGSRIPLVAVGEVVDRFAARPQHDAFGTVAQLTAPLTGDEHVAAVTQLEGGQVFDHHDALTGSQLTHAAVAESEIDACKLFPTAKRCKRTWVRSTGLSEMFTSSMNSKSSALSNPAAISAADGSPGWYCTSLIRRLLPSAGTLVRTSPRSRDSKFRPPCQPRLDGRGRVERNRSRILDGGGRYRATFHTRIAAVGGEVDRPRGACMVRLLPDVTKPPCCGAPLTWNSGATPFSNHFLPTS